VEELRHSADAFITTEGLCYGRSVPFCALVHDCIAQRPWLSFGVEETFGPKYYLGTLMREIITRSTYIVLLIFL